MKKLRTILAAFLLLFITTPVLQSCLDDWDDDEHPLLAIDEFLDDGAVGGDGGRDRVGR